MPDGLCWPLLLKTKPEMRAFGCCPCLPCPQSAHFVGRRAEKPGRGTRIHSPALIRVVAICLDQISAPFDEIEPTGWSVQIRDELKFGAFSVTEVLQYTEAGAPAVIEHQPVEFALVRIAQLFLFHGGEGISPKESDKLAPELLIVRCCSCNTATVAGARLQTKLRMALVELIPQLVHLFVGCGIEVLDRSHKNCLLMVIRVRRSLAVLDGTYRA